VLEHVSREDVSSLLELVAAHAQMGQVPGPVTIQAVIARLTAATDIHRLGAYVMPVIRYLP
jgi:hypothetical protein